MPNKPDFSDLKKKFDLQGVINNVKSMISPEGRTPTPVDDDDVLGQKMEELSMILQQMADNAAEEAKSLSRANDLLNEIYGTVNGLRGVTAEKEEPAAEEVSAPAPEQSAASEASDQADSAEKSE